MPGSPDASTDRIDPAEAVMREVGAQLQRARIERGETLDAIAGYLRIRVDYLAAIEQGDLSVMPGRTYALGFLRSYADHLGFDGEDLIVKIKSTVEDLTGRARLRIRTPMPESRLPGTPIMVLSLILVAGVYAGWSYLNRTGQTMVETVAEVPANLRNIALEALPADDDPGPAPREATAAQSAPPSSATAADRQAQPSDVADVEPTRDTQAPTTATASSEPTAGTNQRLVEPGMTPEAGPDQVPATELPRVRSVAAGAPEPGATPDSDAPSVDAAAANPKSIAEERRSAAAAFDLEIQGITSPATAAALEGRARPMVEPAAGGPAAAPTADAPAAAAPAAALVARLLDPAADGPGSATRVHEPVNRDARVVLRAQSPTWIQVTSTSGNYLRSLTLQPGEAFLVPNRADLQLWTGNAGGLQVLVDGAPIPPLGAVGQVVRDVSLDPEQLRPAAPLRASN